jgi:hypothetical protein
MLIFDFSLCRVTGRKHEWHKSATIVLPLNYGEKKLVLNILAKEEEKRR